MYTVKFFLQHPLMIGDYLLNHSPRLWPDRLYVKMRFYFNYGYRLNLDDPKGFNEKCQWLKLNYRRPEFTEMVDKYTAKAWAAKRIGQEHIVPTYGVWNSFDEIDFDRLPQSFILKCTHDSGGNVVCRDKSKLDKDAARRKLTAALAKNTFLHTREWPYKNVKPRIIAEELLKENSGDGVISDYKFFCFDGEPRVMYVSKDGAADPRTDFFDMEWNHLPVRMRDLNADVQPEKPAQFEEMRQMARTLSAGLPHVRADFYLVNGHIYFGEMTLYTCAGMPTFNPWEWNRTFGDWITLPEKFNPA